MFPELIGSNFLVQTTTGEKIQYLNLDNAATTPAFRVIWDKLGNFLESYGSIHRGSGAKSQLSTAIYEEVAPRIINFLGGAEDEYALIVTHNTTSAVNKLSRMLSLSSDDAVFLSEFEHSANDLPWRKNVRIIRIPADARGEFDLDYFRDALQRTEIIGKKIVTVSGASNITGAITPIHEIARLAHAHGAYIMVDAAQLVAHREIELKGRVEDGIDFITFSGHKMYAPFGGGVLVGRRDLLEKMVPDDIGGGNVDFVTHDSYHLAKNFSKRTTAGTPNVLGAVSIALSCELLKNKIGFKSILTHEQAILDHAEKIFPSLGQVQTYYDLDYDANKKCSILAFNVDGVDPNVVAVRLGHEFGIGVRQGAICQYSFVAKVLGMDAKAVESARLAAVAGENNATFGIVRASFGLGNNPADVDRLADALREIIRTPKKQRDFVNSEGPLKPQKTMSDFFRLKETD